MSLVSAIFTGSTPAHHSDQSDEPIRTPGKMSRRLFDVKVIGPKNLLHFRFPTYNMYSKKIRALKGIWKNSTKT